jgi:hypothetical protein
MRLQQGRKRRQHLDGDPERLLVFIEPCLAFSPAERQEDRVRLRVHFSPEALPPWLRDTCPDPFDYFVVIDLSAVELAEAADASDIELALFPER